MCRGGAEVGAVESAKQVTKPISTKAELRCSARNQAQPDAVASANFIARCPPSALRICAVTYSESELAKKRNDGTNALCWPL